MTRTSKRSAKRSVVPAAEAFFKESKKLKKEALIEVRRVAFPELETAESSEGIEPESFGSIPVPVTVELGKAEMSLKEVLDLAEGSIVPLNRLAGEPLDLKVSGQLIAQGEVVAIDNNYGIRVTKLLVK